MTMPILFYNSEAVYIGQKREVQMKAIEKELQRIKKLEERLCRQAEKKTELVWKSKLEEKIFILKMLETAMLTGEAWGIANEVVDAYIEQDVHGIPEDDVVKQQIEKTANAFATDMLVTKFIQGLPIVGMLGGATNPVYYHKVMSYVQLKYRKRYLRGKMVQKR